MNNNFYAVYGANGYGIFGSWNAVQKNMVYLSKANCKKFSNRYEAAEYAIEMHLTMNSNSLLVNDPEEIKLNYLYFTKASKYFGEGGGFYGSK